MMVEDWQDKRATVSEAQRAVIAEATKKMGALWVAKTLAKLEGHRRGLPKSPGDKANSSGSVEYRKNQIVQLLTENPGLSRPEISAAISGLTDNDLGHLRIVGRIHSSWTDKRCYYYAGPAEAKQ